MLKWIGAQRAPSLLDTLDAGKNYCHRNLLGESQFTSYIHWYLLNFLFPLLVVTFLPLQYDNLDVFFEGGIILDNMTWECWCPFSITINESQKKYWWKPVSRLTFPHEKINQCLTDINWCWTNIFKIQHILTNI